MEAETSSGMRSGDAPALLPPTPLPCDVRLPCLEMPDPRPATSSTPRWLRVDRTSLVGASLFVVAAVLFAWVIGPLGLVVLVAAGLLMWYALGPGAELRRTVPTG